MLYRHTCTKLVRVGATASQPQKADSMKKKQQKKLVRKIVDTLLDEAMKDKDVSRIVARQCSITESRIRRGVEEASDRNHDDAVMGVETTRAVLQRVDQLQNQVSKQTEALRTTAHFIRDVGSALTGVSMQIRNIRDIEDSNRHAIDELLARIDKLQEDLDKISVIYNLTATVSTDPDQGELINDEGIILGDESTLAEMDRPGANNS
ncbi:hypothetical protein SEA_LITTLEFELLA_72 [Gordonia phage LittleFella]|nr:hypothetical protein SEA_LITTLEFELLA_72 [Gordonia phage LittleFella]